MTNKVVAPAALNALKEALTNIYWYKAELRSFITNTISDSSILSKLDWETYKRNIVARLIDYLASNQGRYQCDLLRLINEVIKIEDFSHLEQLDDGSSKACKAKDAVAALRKLSKGHFDLMEEEKKKEKRRKVAYEKCLKRKGVKEKLYEVKTAFLSLVSSDVPQSRGFKLEKIMRDLFELFDLDPKASFKIEGEQIDGAFTFDNVDYLFEAKWQKELVGREDLDIFAAKLGRKLENTLGLFLSMNGYSDAAVKAHASGRRLMILMDGSDLMAVLEGRIDLLQLLLRKRRHAAQTGDIYFKIQEIIAS